MRPDYDRFIVIPVNWQELGLHQSLYGAKAPFTGSYFCQQLKGLEVREKSKKQLYRIPLEFTNGVIRTVRVKASSREVAEERALKFHPNALGVKRDA